MIEQVTSVAQREAEGVIKKSIQFLIGKIFSAVSNLKNEKQLKKSLEDYMLCSYKHNIFMNSFILGNTRRSILEVYQPLTICNESKKQEKYTIDSENIDFIKKYKNILLVDSAGMGKSTLVKYISIQMLIEKSVIPIIIELRNLEGMDIVEYIMDQITYSPDSIQKVDLMKILEQGQFLMFFDGYDEIEERYKSSIIIKIKKFVKKLDNNLYILTSRPEQGLYSFGEFQMFRINKLSLDEAYQLMKKISDNDELAEMIKKELENDKNFNNIKDLLGNPLLISLLYKTFECGVGVKIPNKKSEFYKQIFYTFFEKHDRSKDPTYTHYKESGLDAFDFNAVLRRIGFKCLEEKNIEYDKNKFLNIIANALQEMRWITSKREFICHDLICAVPYFEDIHNNIKWIHKSFMEYFAASFIGNDISDKAEILKILFDKPYEYYNVLDFCYELDIKNFRINIIYPLLVEYLENYEEQKAKIDVRIEDFSFRKSFLLCTEAAIVVIEEKDLNLTDDEILYTILKDNQKFPIKKVIRESGIVLVCKDYTKKALLTLLYEKKVDIFKYKKDYVQNINTIRPGKLPIKEYNINMSEKNLINRHDYFLSINTILAKKMDIYNLDYSKCKKMHEEISREIRESSSPRKYNL